MLTSAFRFILDINNTEVHRYLTELESHLDNPIENRSLKVQLDYSARWCALSIFLYSHRDQHFKVPDPQLTFKVQFSDSKQICSTPVHWYQSFYQVDLLSKKLREELVDNASLDLIQNVMSHNPAFKKISNRYTADILETIALLNLCLKTVKMDCKSFESEPVVECFRWRLRFFQIIGIWLRAIKLWREEKAEEALALLQACEKLISESDRDIAQNPLIDSLARNIKVQIYLCAAEHCNMNGKTEFVRFCYTKAKQEGWKASTEADELLKEEETDPVEEKEVLQPESLPEVYLQGACGNLKFFRKQLKLRPCKTERTEFKPTKEKEEKKVEQVIVV